MGASFESANLSIWNPLRAHCTFYTKRPLNVSFGREKEENKGHGKPPVALAAAGVARGGVSRLLPWRRRRRLVSVCFAAREQHTDKVWGALRM